MKRAWANNKYDYEGWKSTLKLIGDTYGFSPLQRLWAARVQANSEGWYWSQNKKWLRFSHTLASGLHGTPSLSVWFPQHADFTSSMASLIKARKTRLFIC